MFRIRLTTSNASERQCWLAANTEFSNNDLHIAIKIVNFAKRKAVTPWWWERVGYVKTQLFSMLIIMLTTMCFSHCLPTSGHK